MTRSVIFDFDGTLVTLDVPIEKVRAEVEALRIAAGLSPLARPILGAIRELTAVDAAAGARARAILDRAEATAAEVAPLRPTAVEVIRELEAAGGVWAVVSNNGRACVDRGIARLGGSPALVVTRDDVAEPKPDPEGLLAAMAAVGRSAVFIGDGAADAGAAAAARARGADVEFVGVRGGPGAAEGLRAAGVEQVADTLRAAVARAT